MNEKIVSPYVYASMATHMRTFLMFLQNDTSYTAEVVAPLLAEAEQILRDASTLIEVEHAA